MRYEMKTGKIKVVILLFIVSAFLLAAVSEAVTRNERRELRQKGDEVMTLLKSKREQGADVSDEVREFRKARQAMQMGLAGQANDIMDGLLEKLKDKERPENEKGNAALKAEGDAPETVINLKIDMREAYVTSISMEYSKGKEVPRFEKALSTVHVKSKDGKLTFPISMQPVFITAEKPSLPVAKVKPSAESPFGFHPAKVEDIAEPYQYAEDIGVSWHRPKRYFSWIAVQKDFDQKEYDWSFYDNEIKQVPADINLLYNIVVSPPLTSKQNQAMKRAKRAGLALGKFIRKNSYLPTDREKYMDFVTACVERYDGDGIDDMPGLKKPIRYWQVGNEPHPKLEGFAEFVMITSKAIKRADPSARVVIGGALRAVMEDTSKFDRTFLKILEQLDGKYVDIIDFHWGGDAQGNYRAYRVTYDHLRRELDRIGFPKSTSVWITEMSTYSGDPVKKSFIPTDPAFQTEHMQAADMIKRYVYGLSIGVEKIFWAWGMMEGFKNDDTYFDHTGFIYDGKFSHDEGNGVKKLAYYAYKLMTAMLDGSDWSSVRTVTDGKEGLYIYEFAVNGQDKKVYVVWWDYFNK